VRLVPDLWESGSSRLLNALGGCKALTVTTPTVFRLHGERLVQLLNDAGLPQPAVLSCTEQSKSPEKALEVCAMAARQGLARRDVLIAIGGGVCSDIVRLAASLIRRGIRFICIPTTLVGQVDASIGIKAAVNFEGRKSFLGSYYPADEVLIAPQFLSTLPTDQLAAGFAEILKIAIVHDEKLFEMVEAEGAGLLKSHFSHPSDMAADMIWSACQAMLEELAPNIYEDQSFERRADFAHTFSPRLECASGFSLSHGHAVAIDMAFSSAISHHLGYLNSDEFFRILRATTRLHLPIMSPHLTMENCRAALAEAAHHRGGCVNVVVPVGIGDATFIRHASSLPDKLLRRSLATVREASSAIGTQS
jgi:3-dehydroquinate synthase